MSAGGNTQRNGDEDQFRDEFHTISNRRRGNLGRIIFTDDPPFSPGGNPITANNPAARPNFPSPDQRPFSHKVNPIPFDAAVQMEKDLAEDLRAQGNTVTGGT
jgi:hypothetical protein